MSTSKEMSKKQKVNGVNGFSVQDNHASSDDDEMDKKVDGSEVEKVLNEFVTVTGAYKYLVQVKRKRRQSDENSTFWVKRQYILPGAEAALARWEVEKQEKMIERRTRYAQTGIPISLFTGVGITRYNTILEELGLGPNQMLEPDMVFPSSVDPAADGISWDDEVARVKAEAEAFLEEEIATSTRPGSSMSAASSAHEPIAQLRHERHSPRKGAREATPRTLSSTSGSRPGSGHASEGSLAHAKRGSKSPEKPKRSERRNEERDPSEKHSQNESRKQTPQKTTHPGHRRTASTPLKRSSISDATEFTPSKRRNTGKERMTDRTILQDKWNHVIQKAGAAPVTIVNEVDDELIPPSVDVDTFVYIETGSYVWDGDAPTHDGFFIGCDGWCYDPADCDCQSTEFAEEIMIEGKRSFAYDILGRYVLPDDSRVAVFECNQVCECDLTCRNRVSQRPRDIPMEVFKTRKRGWGVRATAFIPKGKVLGVFTGALVPSSHDDGWCYDLDWFEVNFKWRVSSKHCGNWSRFLNHSCYPNIKVYAVIFDSVPDAGEDHRHRLAFVAIKDIEARTELVVDYSPQTKSKSGKCCEFGGCAPN